MSRAPLILVLLVSIASAAPCAAAPHAEPTWTRQLDQDVEWCQVSLLGHLVVATKRGISALDPRSGAPLWTRAAGSGGNPAPSTVKGSGGATWRWSTGGRVSAHLTNLGLLMPSAARQAGYVEYLTRDRRRVVAVVWEKPDFVVLDAATGSELWRIDRAEWAAAPVLIDGHRSGLLLLLGITPDHVARATALDWADGRTAWARDDLLGGGTEDWSSMVDHGMLHGPRILCDSDSTMVLWPCNGSATRLELATGRSLWTKPDYSKIYPQTARATSRAAAWNGYLVVTEGSGAVGFDAATGDERWRRARLFPDMGDPIRALYKDVRAPMIEKVTLRSTPSAILAVGPLDTYIMALDPRTGGPLWSEPQHAYREKSGATVRGDMLYLAFPDSVCSLDARIGDRRALGGVPFTWDEGALHLSAFPEGVFLKSWRRFAFLEMSGTIRYDRVFAGAPPKPKGNIFFQSLQVLAMTWNLTGVAIGATDLSGNSNPGWNWTSLDVPSAPQRSAPEDLVSVLSKISGAPGLGGEPPRAPTQSDALEFMRTECAGQPCLVVFDALQGRDLMSVPLRDESAACGTDPLRRRIFVLDSKRDVRCYEY